GCQVRIDDAQPSMDTAHRIGQLICGRVFDHEAARAGVEGALEITGTSESGHHQNACARRCSPNLLGGVDPVETWHLDIHQNDVHVIVRGGLGYLVASLDFSHHLEVGLEVQQRDECAAHHVLTVGE